MRILAAMAISFCMLASGALSQTSRDQETIRITKVRVWLLVHSRYDFEILAPMVKSYLNQMPMRRDKCHKYQRTRLRTGIMFIWL